MSSYTQDAYKEMQLLDFLLAQLAPHTSWYSIFERSWLESERWSVWYNLDGRRPDALGAGGSGHGRLIPSVKYEEDQDEQSSYWLNSMVDMMFE